MWLLLTLSLLANDVIYKMKTTERKSDYENQ